MQIQREGPEDSSRLCREAAGDGPGHAPDVLLPLPAGPPPPPPGHPLSTPMLLLTHASLMCQVLHGPLRQNVHCCCCCLVLYQLKCSPACMLTFHTSLCLFETAPYTVTSSKDMSRDMRRCRQINQSCRLAEACETYFFFFFTRTSADCINSHCLHCR